MNALLQIEVLVKAFTYFPKLISRSINLCDTPKAHLKSLRKSRVPGHGWANTNKSQIKFFLFQTHLNAET